MKEVSRDEQMYCTAGVLLAGGQSIYKDFSYPSQLPCHPLLLAALYKDWARLTICLSPAGLSGQ